MDKLLDIYRQTFDEQFPLMLCRGMAEEDISQIIQQCLDDNKPYRPKLDPNVDY